MPRDDSRYRGQPLSLAFEVGFQRIGSVSYEWIQPPSTPANIYEDFLKRHGEGIQHIGMPVDDLSKATAAYEKLGFAVWQAGAWGISESLIPDSTTIWTRTKSVA